MTAPLRSKTTKLNDGHEMPLVGLGTFQGTYDYKVNNIPGSVNDINQLEEM